MSVASSTIFIRPAAVFDAEAMAAIHRACFARNWSADEIAQFMGAPGRISLLASPAPQQTVQGFLIARGAGDEAEILTLAVDPSHRRQGLARALLTAAIDSLRKAGAKWLFLEVESGNKNHLLPVPAAFVIDQKGKVHYVYYNADYKVRVDAQALLKAAEDAVPVLKKQ